MFRAILVRYFCQQAFTFLNDIAIFSQNLLTTLHQLIALHVTFLINTLCNIRMFKKVIELSAVCTKTKLVPAVTKLYI